MSLSMFVFAFAVHSPAVRGTIVVFGSSVVDGTGSSDCGPGCTPDEPNLRWTNHVARRVTAAHN
ncbi:hypothetical protein OHB35_02415 [Streptomyces phaeochromogenes]|uniref:Uncharacterized protein n=1 Tax=Streptomyces phaeochromogenes TaxID=1923 RepID=A0ABZ1H3P4_STRPH|nr:hypothetical protein [Streptomyces phaeochromogenes]WSD12146.1 hypothetical protein OHB35_02415 [Streptomyces phaeochromogenes]